LTSVPHSFKLFSNMAAVQKKPIPTPLTDADHKTREWFIATRESMDLSRPELAQELCLTTRAIHHYEVGERVIPKRVVRMLELLTQAKTSNNTVGA
jgi:hypothetical protein